MVDDEQTIPNDYIVVETKINKAQLKADLKEGLVVSGAHLETRKNIQIR
ncbi:MAG: siphovirus Gp157 family protein [Alistipes sp.]|nr:siphovirus Gp157 family protein [Alistipes sp.]